MIRAIFVWYGLLAAEALRALDWRGDRRCRFASAYRRVNELKAIGHQFLSGDIYFIDFLQSKCIGWTLFYVLVTALLLNTGELVSGAAGVADDPARY
ncbi:hypothetical protein KCP75_09715 [Salmonella enterica subsp. enterica]|nr:hypothetical protein KCP75_09715 [Salmonella enterica subsp. enterica]